MRSHITDDDKLRRSIIAALARNDNYCPCVVGSKGKPEYECMCKDFVEHVPVGQSCHCGLYIKDEM